MFNKKQAKPRRTQGGNLSQFGLFDVPSNLNFDGQNDDNDDDEGDSDLEAELLALAGGGGTKPKRPARRKPAPAANLDSLVAASMRDIPSDEEMDGDDDDPDLLNELNELTGEDAPEASPADSSPQSPSKETATSLDIKNVLEERLKMYQTAEANAKAAGETSRARRFGRGIKTLKDQIKQANAGKPINDDDIPPEVSVNIQKRDPPVDQPSRPAPPPPSESASATPSAPSSPPAETPELSDETKAMLEMLKERKEQYKNAALKAKKAGNSEVAVAHVKIVKQFDAVMKAVVSGQPVDLSRMPGPPVEEDVPVENTEAQNDGAQPEAAEPEVAAPEAEEVPPEPQLITASSVAEALQQRLEVYKAQEAAAKEQENASKARRMGRIVKQFEQAIKLHKLGKPVPFDELPTPPGYAPIPGTVKPPPEPEPPKPVPPKPVESPGDEDKPAPPQRQPSRTGNHIPTTRMEKQLLLLKARQREFKEAALEAKKKGELTQAKEFLRTAKGFDPLIVAAEGGLPVDIASLPIPPSAKSHLDTEYELVMAEECKEDDDGVMDVVTRLEQQLTKQLKMCLTTRDHHKAIGDVAGMNRFERLALTVTKDLDIIRIAKRTCGASVPKFHYETRDFSIVKSFTDLNDNDFELSITRGVNYNCSNPKDIDTYVKFDFPFPQETPYQDRTSTVKDTNNPEYNATFVIPIQRTARTCLRVFKRQAVKFEVYSKGGFFRSDTLLGTVSVKLQPLETQCELHDSFDLMDGRKKVGGKLEIRMRVRDPMVSKEVQRLSERWLIIDH